jgi:hypothetical protein
MKEDEMGGTCGTYGREDIYYTCRGVVEET